MLIFKKYTPRVIIQIFLNLKFPNLPSTNIIGLIRLLETQYV